MERIFHYLAALFTRLLFCIHAVAMVYWLVLVKKDDAYFLFLLMLGALLLETLFTVGYRKGHEYSWFCPSMFLYLMTVIPCDWIAKREVINCVARYNSEVECLSAVNSSGIKDLLNSIRVDDDERLLYTMEQALVLILVIGRWLLPKGGITRDQLSQLLLIYIGTAADIMEFTEIIKDDDIRAKHSEILRNRAFVNAVILFWSVSLFQFTLTVYAMERTAQRLEKEKAQLEEELRKAKEERTTRKRNQVAPNPALYANRSHAQRENYQLRYIQTSRGLQIKPDVSEEKEPEMTEEAKDTGCWHKMNKKIHDFFIQMQDYTELVSLLIPMLMQDGPFLIMRLIVIAYYKVYHDTLYFLTVKNALVVMLQVYRIFVLYYKPPAEDVDEMFPEYDHSNKLTNVQTAIKSVQHTRMAIRLVSRLQRQARWRNAGRMHTKRSRPSRSSADVEAAKTAIASAKRESVTAGPRNSRDVTGERTNPATS